MENLAMNWGFIFGGIAFVIAFLLYLLTLKINKEYDKWQVKIWKQRELLSSICSIIFPEKSVSYEEIKDREILKRTRSISREHKNLWYEVLELEWRLDGTEKILQSVRSDSAKKNLVISKQKRRILEFEVASYFVRETPHKDAYAKALAMLRKMTIKELEHEKNSWENPKKVCKKTKSK